MTDAPGPERLVVTPAERGAFARAVADEIARGVRAAVAARGRCHLALPGGRTPRDAHRELAERDLPWTSVDVWFGDERCVPASSRESNARSVRESLAGAPLPPERIHAMPVEDADPEAAATRYEQELPERLDLIVLGLGEDGHCASLFPGSPALGETRRRVVAVQGPKPPALRLTVTPPVLRASRQLMVVAAGAAKARAVNRALVGTDGPESVPARLARHGTWVLDALASAGLATPSGVG